MNNKAMYALSYGLFVVSTKVGEKDNGCITNTAIQVTSDPNQIALAVNCANYTNELMKQAGIFNISVISEEADFELFKRFGFQSGRDVDKYAGFADFARTANGLTYVTKGTNAFLSAKITKEVELGTHTLFIAEVTDMDVLSQVPSATYSYYQSNIKPKPQPVGETKTGQTVWRCKICGYEYVGEELPDDFICPICKHPKSDFEKIVK
ncbi:MAG: flavin reductase [Lachnospiraceae bacterium]|nr:flavin reductase [Lachnospiraceae bacterium]MBR6469660.1 flavin reductase [Lachnospiraceae bacterium]MBR6485654.1 flavin reductase [Lachnospiraceae bacterium]